MPWLVGFWRQSAPLPGPQNGKPSRNIGAPSSFWNGCPSPNTKQHHLTALLALISWRGDFWQTDNERARALRHIERAIEIASADANASALGRLKAYKGEEFQDELLLVEALRHAQDVDDLNIRAEVEGCVAGYYGQRGRFEESVGDIDRAVANYAEIGAAAIEQGLIMAGNGRSGYAARAGELERSLGFAGARPRHR